MAHPDPSRGAGTADKSFLTCWALLRSPGVVTAMAERQKQPTTKQKFYSRAVYHIKGTPTKLVAIVDAPDVETAIARAIEAKTASNEAAGAFHNLDNLGNGPRRTNPAPWRSPRTASRAPSYARAVLGSFCKVAVLTSFAAKALSPIVMADET
jgi:hypothetical protein